MDIRQIVKNLKIPLPEAEILLAHVLNKSREFIISHPETKTNKRQINKLNKAVNKRLNSVPLPYILGYKYFYGLKFLVNKSVLIPRPETELMVDEALKNITPSPQPITIMEVGTGSGCVIISIIKNLYLKSKTLSLKFFATDISRSALVVAKKNAKEHNVCKRIKFFRGNLLKPFLKHCQLSTANRQLLIIANLPYLTPAQIKNSPTIKSEPKTALSAGKDGLKYYRQLFKQLRKLTASYSSVIVMIEINPGQTNKIKRLIRENLPLSSIKIKKDLRGLNRLVIAKFP